MKLRRRPAPKPLTGKVALVTGGGSGIGRAIAEAFADAGAVVAVVDVNLESALATSEAIGHQDRAIAIEADVTDEAAVKRAVEEAVCAYGGVDIVINNAASAMIAQGKGGDIIYIVSKNAVVAGPNNLAYGSAKASQAHQVRLLAAELGTHGIRVNGINPDGVVQGSGIFAGGWGADRAKVYGVPEAELGKFYADRTLLKQEVLPEHVARAALALVGGALSQTTGLMIPVDSGVVPAFLR
jgi:NAD(P)-dependent dehydrogenase (short-subunit alcohol dehydrogenase family)